MWRAPVQFESKRVRGPIDQVYVLVRVDLSGHVFGVGNILGLCGVRLAASVGLPTNENIF